MKLETPVLISLLPPGPPIRRLELFMSLEAVRDYMISKRGEYVMLELRESPLIAMRYKMPVLTIRAAIDRLARAVNAHHTPVEAA